MIVLCACIEKVVTSTAIHAAVNVIWSIVQSVVKVANVRIYVLCLWTIHAVSNGLLFDL